MAVSLDKHDGFGFCGQFHEPASGWQILGNGYRAYNPVLMRFHSPDSLSPFAAGGFNAYAYCRGDPVNLADPQGHTPWGALKRLTRNVKTTGSTLKAPLPELLATNTQGGAARLSKIKPKHGQHLERIKERLQEKIGYAMERFQVGDDAVGLDQARLVKTVEALEYVKTNLGHQGITKEASRELKKVATVLERQDAAEAAQMQQRLRTTAKPAAPSLVTQVGDVRASQPHNRQGIQLR